MGGRKGSGGAEEKNKGGFGTIDSRLSWKPYCSIQAPPCSLPQYFSIDFQTGVHYLEQHLGPEQLHDGNPAIDVHVYDWFQTLGGYQVHHKVASLRFDQVQVLGPGEVSGESSRYGCRFVRSHYVVIAHSRKLKRCYNLGTCVEEETLTEKSAGFWRELTLIPRPHSRIRNTSDSPTHAGLIDVDIYMYIATGVSPTMR